MDYIILLAGFFLLIKGADYFVDGASAISNIAKIPPLLIGLTIVAFGTSAPEAAVSISASLKGANEIVVGNIIGSNIFNLLPAIGIAAIIRPIFIKKNTIIREFPFAVFATLLMLVLSFNHVIGEGIYLITRVDGILLLLAFMAFLSYLIYYAFFIKEAHQAIYEIPSLSLPKSMIYLLLGLIMILAGGNFVVDAGSNLALALGLSQTLVAVLLIALGTSLPELVTTIAAALKGEEDIAVGSIIGSCLFNILFVLGASALAKPVVVIEKVFSDMIFLLLITILVYFFAYTERTITKKEGWVLTVIYLFYVAFLIIRN